MNNEKLTANMSLMDMMMVMSQGNPGALTVLMQMMENPNGILDIVLLDSLDIRGSKIWMLYSDSCNQDMGKFQRTLMALRSGAYTTEEIQDNLSLCNAQPFLDDSITIEGIPAYEKHFGPAHPKWEEYIEAQRNVIIPKIQERIEAEKNFKTR